VGHGLALPPATNIFYGVEDPRGYEALTLAQFVEMWPLWCKRHGLWFNRVDDLTRPFLSFMNVRFAVQSDALPVPAGWREIARHPGALLLENTNVIERVFVPARVTISDASPPEIVDRMRRLADFRTMTWITEPTSAHERNNGPGAITLRSRSRGGEYLFDADMQWDGFVVISDAAWKGWRASVDGRRTPLKRANGAFLAVMVPKGRHSVRVFYWPAAFVRGRAISITTLMLIAVAAFLVRYGRGTLFKAKG
jgi:hypothetical protein